MWYSAVLYTCLPWLLSKYNVNIENCSFFARFRFLVFIHFSSGVSLRHLPLCADAYEYLFRPKFRNFVAYRYVVKLNGCAKYVGRRSNTHTHPTANRLHYAATTAVDKCWQSLMRHWLDTKKTVPRPHFKTKDPPCKQANTWQKRNTWSVYYIQQCT